MVLLSVSDVLDLLKDVGLIFHLDVVGVNHVSIAKLQYINIIQHVFSGLTEHVTVISFNVESRRSLCLCTSCLSVGSGSRYS